LNDEAMEKFSFSFSMKSYGSITPWTSVVSKITRLFFPVPEHETRRNKKSNLTGR
jgi:hypothetical protein